MQFKTDENIPGEAVDLLRAAGHDVLSVFDESLSGWAASRIASVCQREDRTLITLDTDFADYLMLSRQQTVMVNCGSWNMNASASAAKPMEEGRGRRPRASGPDCGGGQGGAILDDAATKWLAVPPCRTSPARARGVG
jgi:predicted nuclease of predicted toxin-antitoxin system